MSVALVAIGAVLAILGVATADYKDDWVGVAPGIVATVCGTAMVLAGALS